MCTFKLSVSATWVDYSPDLCLEEIITASREWSFGESQLELRSNDALCQVTEDDEYPRPTL